MSKEQNRTKDQGKDQTRSIQEQSNKKDQGTQNKR